MAAIFSHHFFNHVFALDESSQKGCTQVAEFVLVDTIEVPLESMD